MNTSFVTFDVREHVATLTLSDSRRMNPLTAELVGAALSALHRVHEERSIRVLVLRAAGRAFSVGADLATLAGTGQKEEGLGDAVAALMTSGNELVMQLRSLPVPVLGVVHGAAAGGGVGIALAADVVVAARSAYFYLPFVPALGLVPDMGGAWAIQRAVGRARALALTVLGERLGAEQAAQWGLIWSCVDDDKLDEEAATITARLAALPAHGIAEARALHDQAETRSLGEQLVYERDRQRELIEREPFREGVNAFLAKRKPDFPGR